MAHKDEWIGNRSGTANLWNDPTNWSKDVPGNVSDATIGAPGTYTVVINADDRPYQVRNLALGGSSQTVRLSDNGSLSVTNSVVLTHGIFDVGPGATGNVVGDLSLDTHSRAMAGGVLNVGGTISGDGGDVEVNGGGLFAASLAGSNAYSLSLEGTLEVGGAVSPASTFAFTDDSASTLLLDDPGTALDAKVAGFGGGNVIDISSLPFSSSLTTEFDGKTLTIENGGSPVFTVSDISSPGSFSVSDDGHGGTDVTACYVAGTHIATPEGEVLVENLREKDAVLIVAGEVAASMPVRWIGHRAIDIPRHPKPETVLPVRILRDAFTGGVPHRDLQVSPEHCIFADGVLIPARRLINGATIVQDRHARSVEYFHVEFDTHALLFAEGLPAESYLDTGNRAFYDNAGLAIVLHPEFTVNASLRTWQDDACAPLAVDDAVVEPVWRRLAARAEALCGPIAAPPTSDDPQLRVVVNGRTLRAASVENDVHTFALPRGADVIHIVSRSGAPALSRPWLDDQRRLGVAVQRIRLRSNGELAEIPVDHPALREGWHKFERHGTRLIRWTDGSAALDLPSATTTGVTLELHLSGSVPYAVGLPACAA